MTRISLKVDISACRESAKRRIDQHFGSKYWRDWRAEDRGAHVRAMHDMKKRAAEAVVAGAATNTILAAEAKLRGQSERDLAEAVLAKALAPRPDAVEDELRRVEMNMHIDQLSSPAEIDEYLALHGIAATDTDPAAI